MTDYRQRLARLQEHLVSNSWEALLIEDSTNLLYLTGLELSSGKLLSTCEECRLLVDGRYIEMGQDKAPCPAFLDEKGVLEEHLRQLNCKQLRFDASNTSYSRYSALTKLVNGIELIPEEAPLQALRMVKDEREATKLRNAAALGSRGYDFVLSVLREGVTEREVARQLEIFWLEQGGEGMAFDPIIAFGANSSKPHYRPDEVPLKIGDPVLIDIGVTLNNYHSDMTRTHFFGVIPSPMEKVYHIVQEAQHAAMAACRPGVTARDLDVVARTLIEDAGYGEQFSHSLGHGIGLEVHEAPTLSSKNGRGDVELQAGMAITLEPGIYLPGVGGVRIEDTVLLTSGGCEDLTQRSKELQLLQPVV